MKVTEHNTITVNASLHPCGHRYEHEGPWSLRVGVRSQPTIIHNWKAKQVLLSIEQPNTKDNFTLIRVMYLKSGQKKPSFVAGCKFHRVRWRRRRDEVIEVKLKKKMGNPFPHPMPVGKYDGSCMYDVGGGFAVFVLQAMTLRKEPELSKPKIIITPGDTEYGSTLRNAARSLSRTDGVEGRGVNAGGFCDG